MIVDPADARLIAVTGPQRSGTRFTAKAIAHDLGWDFIDEMDYGVHSRPSWHRQITSRTAAVIQCPAMMRYVHDDDMPDDVLVVVMIRDVDDILASERRINWDGNPLELRRFGLTEGNSCEVKYAHWNSHKHSGRPARWVELAYDSLADHPLWVPAEERVDFDFKQTTP